MTESNLFDNQTILITGGTGSFGKAMAKRLLEENRCKKVVIFSRDEWKQSEMRLSDPLFNHPKIRYFLGDVRDKDRLCRAFNDVDIIIHAAALKQVPAAEYNPSEFIHTNINGTMNVINAAIDSGVKKVIALSTDKAVNPANLYGATKLCAEKLVVSGNVYVGNKGYPQFSVLRYGNVAGSRGSIIPFWKKLIAEGATSLPLTDEKMTRFWITLEQAVNLVITSLSRMHGGEIFVPKIPSVYLRDLATALAPHLKQEICGIRPGEKINELLISSDEARNTLDCGSFYIITSQILSESRLKNQYKDSKPVETDFIYSSHTNPSWLSIAEIKDYLSKENEEPLNTTLNTQNEKAKNLIKKYVERAWEHHELHIIDEVFDQQVLIHSILGDFHGSQLMKRVIQAWLIGFPDFKATILSTICENGLVISQWKAEGTHLGEFRGVKPTGRKIHFVGVTSYLVKENKVVEYWSYLDMDLIMSQIT